MADWNDVLNEIKEAGSAHDVIRRKYLEKLSRVTGRNVIVYYSGWLQKPGISGLEINDNDKIGFMTTIHDLDRDEGLDLLLHTPGGATAATESLVDYIRQMFGTNIRAIIPQLAMSGGTMIACACEKIIMGKHSSLGPIDPQLSGLPAHGIIEEFEQAHKEIRVDQTKIALWQPIIAKYNPTLIGECRKAISWSEEMVLEWLKTGMLRNEYEPEKQEKLDNIVEGLGNHAITKSHARHLSATRCEDLGLNIEMLEDDHDLQEAVLSLHHACIHTLSTTNAAKIIENQNGKAFIQQINRNIKPN
jgi:ATP-dependent protease ClpP protease subunit